MITAGSAIQATSKKIKRVEMDEQGNPVIIEETTSSIKPSDMAKAIELMSRLQGWDTRPGEEESVTIINDLGNRNDDD